MLTRRNFLKLSGGGFVLAAGGAGAFLTTRTPKQALAPWALAGTYGDPRKQALSYALLAPNPHNRQPWIADLSRADEITLYRDKEKNLPHTDPYDRQLTIGMGCFLELMMMAAGQAGYHVDLTLFPEGEDGPVALARFEKGNATPDALFPMILDRRSCKEPFSDRPVPDEFAETLSSLADVYRSKDQVEKIRELTWQAYLVEMYTHRTLKESVDLMRIGKAEINANPDGIDLGGPFLESLALSGMLSREGLLDTTSTDFKQGLTIYQDMLMKTPAYAVITTAGNDRLHQIEAGRRWLRLNLTTTALGLSLHPVSQALQEYPEMDEHYKAAHRMLAKPGETVQMLGRLGYGPETGRTPRWPLETKIIDG